VDRGEFTLATMPDRVRKVGDLWKALRNHPGADLGAILHSPTRRRRHGA
jgi:hypothetical protein